MIKTLRITGVAAVALAGVVLASVLGPVSLIHFDGRSDRQMEKIIAAPSAVERFRDQYGDKDQDGQDTTPLLVRQAEAFRDYIDPRLPPPVEKTPGPVSPVSRPVVVKPPVTSQKFALVGTSCIPSDPQSSFAYIRLPDNTYQWVKSGSQIGYVTIKEVRKGSILCWDGRRDSEMMVEAAPNPGNQLEVNHAVSASVSKKAPQPVEVKVIENPANRPGISDRRASAEVPGAKASLTDEDHAYREYLVNKINEVKSRSGGEALDRATAEELISELKSSRVSPQETKKLETLGEERSSDRDAVREEQKREFIRRFNLQRASKN